MAKIGWIDFSPEYRQRVSAVLDLLKPEGVLDELGIGSIRDALSDKMFPGINTIQTRAKYFFIVPYILFDYHLLSLATQRKKTPAEYLEKREYEIMWDLADKYEHLDGCGVIGITKRRGEKIMRRPSAIYWNGLNIFGLIKHGGLGVNTFLRNRMQNTETMISYSAGDDEIPGDDSDAEFTNCFNLKFPFNRKWTEGLSLDLTFEESDCLFYRMLEVGKDMLLGDLLNNQVLFSKFTKMGTFANFVKESVNDSELNAKVRSILILSHDFSELIYGAHIAYNCILQENKFNNTVYSEVWNKWIENLNSEMLDFSNFNPDDILKSTFNIKPNAQRFLLNWWNFIKCHNHPIKERNDLIETQEFNTKLIKARIKQNKYDDVKEGKWVGLGKLEYRKPQAKRIIQDIYDGLGRSIC